ncbi:MAG: hypothetical protein U0990_11745 [Candidatus Nanopelagicales bacterium]|nr:hypothetical protein [Candidatus Nanopelagicales bacterium]
MLVAADVVLVLNRVDDAILDAPARVPWPGLVAPVKVLITTARADAPPCDGLSRK